MVRVVTETIVGSVLVLSTSLGISLPLVLVIVRARVGAWELGGSDQLGELRQVTLLVPLGQASALGQIQAHQFHEQTFLVHASVQLIQNIVDNIQVGLS